MLKYFARLAVVSLALSLVACGSSSSPADSAEDASPTEAKKKKSKGSEAETKSEDLPEGNTDPATPAPATDDAAPPFAESAPGEWTWLGPEEFQNAPTCMDGSKTGLGLSRSPNGSKKVLVFMQGGGACFDGQTCILADHALDADSMDAAKFAEWKTANGKTTVMNRDRVENPFKDWNFVFMPYCSGDVFSGANEAGFEGRPQVGFRNVSAYLPRIKSTFKDAEQVVLAGTSAGGYGAAYNYVQVQKAFSSLDVTVIDDSGPPLSTQFTASCLQEKWKTTWKMDTTSPVDGPFPLGLDAQTGKEGNGLFQLVQELISAHPKSKFAFMSHEGDIVMRYFHGIGTSFNCATPGLLAEDFFADGLREVRTIKGDNFLTYYGPGSGHQYFKSDDADMYDTTVDGINLATWLGQVVNGDTAAKRVPAQF